MSYYKVEELPDFQGKDILIEATSLVQEYCKENDLHLKSSDVIVIGLCMYINKLKREGDG